METPRTLQHQQTLQQIDRLLMLDSDESNNSSNNSQNEDRQLLQSYLSYVISPVNKDMSSLQHKTTMLMMQENTSTLAAH